MNKDPNPESRRPWALLILLLIGAVFAIVLLLLRRPPESSPPTARVLPHMGTVPQFSLVNEDGQPVWLNALKGKIWLADFIFTRCSGSCPMMTSAMYQVNQELDSSDDIRLISISVDPSHDTPDILKAYALNNGLPLDRWSFLTGDRAAIYALAKDGFHLAVADSGDDEKLITHSSKLALIDPVGQIRGYYEGTDSNVVQDVRHDIADLRRELREGVRTNDR